MQCEADDLLNVSSIFNIFTLFYFVQFRQWLQTTYANCSIGVTTIFGDINICEYEFSFKFIFIYIFISFHNVG